MVLVDTSAWIEVFRSPARVLLERIVDFDDLEVLHLDRDYQQLAKVSALRVRRLNLR